jgi:rubrerythrin
MRIKYNKEEFEQKAKELADEHDVPLDIMREWLNDAYNKLLKKYQKVSKKDMKRKPDEKELKKELEDMLEKDIEWICPFCETINSGKTCATCGAYLDDGES